jgi:hypothetical protein
MLRVTIENVIDWRRHDRSPPKVLRVIEIKEDDSGSWFDSNYKTRFLDSNRTNRLHVEWREKQVLGLRHDEYTPEKLLYLALRAYLKDDVPH